MDDVQKTRLAESGGADIQASAEPETITSNVLARFQVAVARYPDKVAIRTGSSELTYVQLNETSDRIASMLASDRGTPGRVALAFNQGADAVAAILGVLKSRCAFVSLDVEDGSSRTRSILDDCRPLAVLTNGRNLPWAQELCDGACRIIVTDDLGRTESADFVRPIVPDAEMAYIFYTSGSTGRPKGVCHTHENLGHFISAYGETLGVSADDRLSLLYSLSFSASNMDVFAALLNGATLFPYNIRKQGIAGLADWIDSECITVLHAVPTVFRRLVASLRPGRRLESVKAIDLGGESVFQSDVEAARRCFSSDCLLVNHLAATELSVIAQHKVDRRRDYPAGPVPVGLPAPGVDVCVLRADGTPVGTNEPGELVLYSRYLSTGYWNRPELTEAAFGEDTAGEGIRYYRTGDLAWWADDGQLYYLGRQDQRLKIRGYTVDPSEVEAALVGEASVRQAAVVARGGGGDRPADHLAAFIVAATNAETGAALADGFNKLRENLKKNLPAYMVPTEIIALDILPVTDSGKVDRRRLEQYDTAPARRADCQDPPRGDSERLVAELFSKVLDHDVVSRHDDFFALGGESLKAADLHLELERRLGRNLALEHLFREPTVCGIARYIDDTSPTGSSDNGGTLKVVLPLRTTGCHPPLFLVHGGGGQAFVSPHFLDILGDNQPLYGFQATGFAPKELRRLTLKEMAAKYVREMRQVQPHGPYMLGGLCAGGLWAIEMSRQIQGAGERVCPLLLMDPPITAHGYRTVSWLEQLGFRLQRAMPQGILLLKAERKAIGKVRKLARHGRTSFVANDEDAIRRTVRTGLDLKIKLVEHNPAPYDGPVVMLRSAQRNTGEKRERGSTFRDLLTGDVQEIEVAKKHGEVFDVNNALFARSVDASMAILRRAWLELA